MIVTIDGPAGSGKSTAARGLAQRLGFDFLNTGAMYRAVALAVTRANIPIGDAARIVELLGRTLLEMPNERVLLNQEDVTELIRQPAISDAASRVAVVPHVRATLVGWQRQIAQGRNMVCEGRDQGSVVFPDSPCKFYLHAGLETRAARRMAELGLKGCASTPSRVLEELKIRDERDQTRDVGPLIAADDALWIETDGLNIDQVVDRLEAHVRCRLG